jgi:RNA polymerase sigma-54 factor
LKENQKPLGTIIVPILAQLLQHILYNKLSARKENMAQRHIPYQGPGHRPMTTAHLAQTMTLLEMNNHELAEKIHSELANNPALEVKEDYRCPTCGKRLINQVCPSCSIPPSMDEYSPIVFVSTRRTNTYSGSTSYSEDRDSFEDFSAESEDLPLFVLNQIRTELEPDERLIAATILTSLDDSGLCPTPSIEMAVFHHVPLSKIEHVRSLIQKCDPLGVASETSQDALIIQAKSLQDAGQDIPPSTIDALEKGFYELSHKNNRALAKLIGISISDAKKIIQFISENLNPFPAHAYWGMHWNQAEDLPVRYQEPDVIISYSKKENEPQLMVEVLWPIYGNLKINPVFRKVISSSDQNKAEKLNAEYQKANLLIKCLNQRNHTLVQLMQKLAKEQREFILKGDRFMKPMTRASIAGDLNVHESTISRAVSSKSVQLPSGKIVPISQFFDRSLHIRTIIKEMIANETKPLSDTKITIMLNEKGFDIARRTVAKYRSVEGILPAHLRKNNKPK